MDDLELHRRFLRELMLVYSTRGGQKALGCRARALLDGKTDTAFLIPLSVPETEWPLYMAALDDTPPF